MNLSGTILKTKSPDYFNSKSKKLIEHLKKLGLKKNDTVLVHSNISDIGFTDIDLKTSINILHKSLCTVIGDNGTICVPSFYWEFNKKKVFELNKKSSLNLNIGIYSRYISGLKKSIRSLNPIASIAALGKNAKIICNNKTASAYGIDSPFDILTNLNAKMLFLGVDLRYMTYVHYVEQRVGVPHRYFKLHEGKIIKNGKKINLPIISFVKYNNNKIINDTEGNNKKFSQKNLLKTTIYNKKKLYLIETKKLFKFLKVKLQKDCYYLLKNIPKF